MRWKRSRTRWWSRWSTISTSATLQSTDDTDVQSARASASCTYASTFSSARLSNTTNSASEKQFWTNETQCGALLLESWCMCTSRNLLYDSSPRTCGTCNVHQQVQWLYRFLCLTMSTGPSNRSKRRFNTNQ